MSQMILSYATLWLRLGHPRNWRSQRDWSTEPTNQLKERFSPTNVLLEVLQQLCNKFNERGIPYHGWIFTCSVCQSNLLCETHGWIFTHNVRYQSLTMIKSWVNFHPQSTPCKCYYVEVMGEFSPTKYTMQVLLCWSHGWIFTHKIHHASVIMLKSWVNFYPQST